MLRVAMKDFGLLDGSNDCFLSLFFIVEVSGFFSVAIFRKMCLLGKHFMMIS